MHKRVVVLSLAVAISSALAIRLVGQSAGTERQLVLRAADALGGRDRVMALKTLQIVGYGELAYFNGRRRVPGRPSVRDATASGRRASGGTPASHGAAHASHHDRARRA
jgi:hypothetical protein